MALVLLNVALNIQGVEMPFPIDSINVPLGLLALMSVPDRFDEEEKQQWHLSRLTLSLFRNSFDNMLASWAKPYPLE